MDPDPATFVTDRPDADKKLIKKLLLFEGASFFKDQKKSQNSGNKLVFLTIFAR
jgi:hypothetical protein